MSGYPAVGTGGGLSGLSGLGPAPVLNKVTGSLGGSGDFGYGGTQPIETLPPPLGRYWDEANQEYRYRFNEAPQQQVGGMAGGKGAGVNAGTQVPPIGGQGSINPDLPVDYKAMYDAFEQQYTPRMSFNDLKMTTFGEGDNAFDFTGSSTKLDAFEKYLNEQGVPGYAPPTPDYSTPLPPYNPNRLSLINAPKVGGMAGGKGAGANTGMMPSYGGGQMYNQQPMQPLNFGMPQVPNYGQMYNQSYNMGMNPYSMPSYSPSMYGTPFTAGTYSPANAAAATTAQQPYGQYGPYVPYGAFPF